MESTEALKWLGQTFVTLALAGFFFRVLTIRAESRKINAGASLDETSVTASLNKSADDRVREMMREAHGNRRRVERCENYIETLRQHIIAQDQQIFKLGGELKPMPGWPPLPQDDDDDESAKG